MSEKKDKKLRKELKKIAISKAKTKFNLYMKAAKYKIIFWRFVALVSLTIAILTLIFK